MTQEQKGQKKELVTHQFKLTNFNNRKEIDLWAIKKINLIIHIIGILEHLQKDHILDHKTNIHKFKRIEIMESILSNHSKFSLETSNRKIKGKHPNTWKQKNKLPNIS